MRTRVLFGLSQTDGRQRFFLFPAVTHVGDTSCPADKIQHKISVDTLPCCYAILSNIPAQRKTPVPSAFCCKRHPKKKIKFVCEVHKEYLCTNCVLEHTGTGHKTVAFKADCMRYLWETHTIDEAMKTKVSGLMQRTQQTMRAISKENEELERSRSKIADHYALQQDNLSKAYETAIKTLMDKRKQLSETLKYSLSEQKVSMTKQKGVTCQHIEQALTACESLSRFAENIDGASYEEYHNLVETLNKEIAELESFVATLPHVKVSYLQFYENIVISDKSEVHPERSHDTQGGDKENECVRRTSSRKRHRHAEDRSSALAQDPDLRNVKEGGCPIDGLAAEDDCKAAKKQGASPTAPELMRACCPQVGEHRAKDGTARFLHPRTRGEDGQARSRESKRLKERRRDEVLLAGRERGTKEQRRRQEGQRHHQSFRGGVASSEGDAGEGTDGNAERPLIKQVEGRAEPVRLVQQQSPLYYLNGDKCRCSN